MARGRVQPKSTSYEEWPEEEWAQRARGLEGDAQGGGALGKGTILGGTSWPGLLVLELGDRGAEQGC